MSREAQTKRKKEIEKDTNKWKDIPCPWTGKINIVKICILPKAIYRFNAIPLKILMTFFHKNTENNLKICMKPQKTPSGQSNPEKEKQSWKHHSSCFQPILKSYSNQKVWSWHKSKCWENWIFTRK